MSEKNDVVTECVEVASDAMFSVCQPLLMDGEGNFFARNGNLISNAEVRAD